MLSLEGQIGVLYQNGRQVGGVYDWSIRVVLDYTVSKGIRQYKPVKHLDARSYWLLEDLQDNTFDATFYQVVSNELVVMDAGKVIIGFPDYTLDKRLYAPLSIRWVGSEY